MPSEVIVEPVEAPEIRIVEQEPVQLKIIPEVQKVINKTVAKQPP